MLFVSKKVVPNLVCTVYWSCIAPSLITVPLPPPPCRKQPSEVAGKRLLLFSYGSGLASAMYSLRATSDVARLTQLTANLAELPATLTSRKLVPPQDFESTMKLREETHHSAPYTPVGDVAELRPGTYYLKSVDDKHRRSYERVPLEGGKGATTLKSPLAQLQNGSN